MLVWLVCAMVCFSLGLSCMGLSALLGLGWQFLFPCRGNFDYNLFKYSETLSFFSSSSGTPINLNVEAFNIVSEVSEITLNYFISFSFIMLFSSYSHHSIFQLLGRKAMTNLDSILKSRDITLLTSFHIGKAMVFPIVIYGY